MQRAKPIPLLIFGAFLLLYSMDCFTPAMADAQAMECCATMPCTPANQNSDCCKTMVSGQPSYFQPVAKASVQPPSEIAIATTPELQLPRWHRVPVRAVDANEHGPPRELYIFHLSLLI